jgi:hypothetical protein
MPSSGTALPNPCQQIETIKGKATPRWQRSGRPSGQQPPQCTTQHATHAHWTCTSAPHTFQWQNVWKHPQAHPTPSGRKNSWKRLVRPLTEHPLLHVPRHRLQWVCTAHAEHCCRRALACVYRPHIRGHGSHTTHEGCVACTLHRRGVVALTATPVHQSRQVLQKRNWFRSGGVPGSTLSHTCNLAHMQRRTCTQAHVPHSTMHSVWSCLVCQLGFACHAADINVNATTASRLVLTQQTTPPSGGEGGGGVTLYDTPALVQCGCFTQWSSATLHAKPCYPNAERTRSPSTMLPTT